MKMISVPNCLRCPFSHFTLYEHDKYRLYLYCGHLDRTVTKDSNAYDNTIPEWCDLEDFYGVDEDGYQS